MDESSLGSISNEAPMLSICRVFRLTSFESLEEDNCLIMSDTGLYLNWIPGTLVPDGDEEEEFEATEERYTSSRYVELLFRSIFQNI